MGDLIVQIGNVDLTIRRSAVLSTLVFDGEGFADYEQK
jgi:hypothetical protein